MVCVAWLLIWFGVIGATARLTKLVTTDEIALPFRQWVINGFGPMSFGARLILCKWCVSVWLAMPTTFLGFLGTLFLDDGLLTPTRLVIFLLLVPTAAQIAAMVTPNQEG